MEPWWPIRRSLLNVPVMDRSAVESCWGLDADAVILDMAETVSIDDRPQARSILREAVRVSGKGGAEVFARVSRDTLEADIAAAVTPGLRGVVVNADSSRHVVDACTTLLAAERAGGVPTGTLQIIVLLDTGMGIWDIRSIITASPRVTSVGLDESRLCANLGITPVADFDPFVYAKGRLVIESVAARVQTLGMAHPFGALPRFEDPEETHRLALKGRNTGFKGAICPDPAWIAPCNRAFTPTEEQVAYYREVRREFAIGVARGTAAVPYQGRMIDVPVDERARITLALYEACKRRDAEKAEALAKAKR